MYLLTEWEGRRRKYWALCLEFHLTFSEITIATKSKFRNRIKELLVDVLQC